jgi:CheY-like chemotaxis protein
MMPGQNGYELTKEIKKKNKNSYYSTYRERRGRK